MSRLRNRCVQRGAGTNPARSDIALASTGDGVDRIKHRDVHDRHGATRPGRPQLFPKHAILSRGDGRVVEPSGIDRNGIPTTKALSGVVNIRRRRRWRGRRVRHGLETRSQGIVQILESLLRRRGLGENQSKQRYG